MKKVYYCVFDGSCEPRNPGGNLGIGAAIFEGGTYLVEQCSYTEKARPSNTNNMAEYKAILWVLNKLLELGLEKEEIVIQGDSMLVVQQLNGFYRIKKGAYVPYAEQAKEKLKKFKNISIKWIKRENNTFADSLSKPKNNLS